MLVETDPVAEQRLDALTDSELLSELRNTLTAVLGRIALHGSNGLDPDELEVHPKPEELHVGLAFVAQVESLIDHFLLGPGEQGKEFLLVGWYVGLRHLRNELTSKARLLAAAIDPRTEAGDAG